MAKFFTNTLLYERAKKLTRLNRFNAFKFAIDRNDAKHLIIEMNTIDQLYNKGIDSKGRSLKSIGGDYSYVTKDIKSHFNQPIDRITLKDTGEFYESFNVRVTSTDFQIQADTIKDDDDLTDRWGEDILGLTETSLNKLREFAKIKYIEYVRTFIQ